MLVLVHQHDEHFELSPARQGKRLVERAWTRLLRTWYRRRVVPLPIGSVLQLNHPGVAGNRS